MNSDAGPIYRLINMRRRLRDLLVAHRLSLDPERTGVVELADFGKRCARLADFGRETAAAFDGCVGRVGEELELAGRLGALMETLPRTSERLESQTGLLEEVARMVDAAIEADADLDEPPVVSSLATLARRERELFQPFVSFEGTIHDSPPGFVDQALLRRRLRRALLDHDEREGDFGLELSRQGVLRFGAFEFAARPAGDELERSPVEPPEVKRALDMRAGTDHEDLRAFLLVKAVDEALAAVLNPELRGSVLVERARALPRRPGKRMAVRPEAVQLEIAGWDRSEAARGAEKLAARRIGPDWARLPRGAYLLRLFLSENDELAADLLALGASLRRMEKGQPVAGTDPRAVRALRGLLGLLG